MRAMAFTPVLNPTGTMTFTWHGSASRGCQAAGVCGVSGSLDVIPEDQTGASESPPSRNVNVDDEAAVVRVTDPGSTPDDPHVCTDLIGVDITFMIMAAKHGGAEAFDGGPDASPSSGRCAGPLEINPTTFHLPARKLPGPTEAYSLAGKRTFGAGPYEVTMTSTIRAERPHTTGIGGNPFGIGGSASSSFPQPRPGLLESVEFTYRLSIAGSLTASFAGRPDPFCTPLDTCGTSGSVTDSLTPGSIPGGGNVLEIGGQRVVHHVASRARALADLYAGRLAIEPAGDLLVDLASARVSFPDGSLCTDQLRQPNGLDIDANPADDRRVVVFALSAVSEGPDPLRTYCPGPSSGDAPIQAHASTPIRTLGDHQLQLVLPATGRFTSGSYTGVRSGSVSIDLTLERVRAGTQHTTVFPGEP
jgi:hypothetical protein